MFAQDHHFKRAFFVMHGDRGVSAEDVLQMTMRVRSLEVKEIEVYCHSVSDWVHLPGYANEALEPGAALQAAQLIPNLGVCSVEATKRHLTRRGSRGGFLNEGSSCPRSLKGPGQGLARQRALF